MYRNDDPGFREFAQAVVEKTIDARKRGIEKG